MRTIVVAGTDTSVGKTVFAAALAKLLGGYYWKPVQSGRDPSTDSARAMALGVPAGRILKEGHVFSRPLSPHRSAELDGVRVDLERLACLPHPPDASRALIVELAGGLLVPLTREVLQVELLGRWGAPVVLCARTSLGTINHTLLSIEALKSRGISLLGVAFIGKAMPDTERTIEAMSGVRRLGRLDWIAGLDEDPRRSSKFLHASFRKSFSGIKRVLEAGAPMGLRRREKEEDGSPVWRPYTQHATAEPPLVVESARGSTLYTRDGREVFDAISSWWVTLHGHSHPKIVSAIGRQAGFLDQALFADCTHEPAERLSRELVRLAPRGLSKVFYSDDGSTAVEAGLKMAIGFWHNKGRGRGLVAALEGGYHGDTFGAMSAGERGPFTKAYAPFLFDVLRLPFPEPTREALALERSEELLKRHRDRIAALIVEPLVQGVSGMRMYSPAALKALHGMCRRWGVLFIADEVMTGFGRTGPLFACEAAGISPDVLCLSKGITGGSLALGATLASEEIFRGFFSKDRSRAFFHGHSYTANPIACRAALANLEIFKEEPVAERIAAQGRLHEAELKRLLGTRKRLPGGIRVRRLGTIAALEIPCREPGYLSGLGRRLARFYLSRNVLLRPLGNIVYIMAPYCSAPKEIRHAYDVIEESFELS
jgi:adenosylmethionine-8-amino-7-oxononanoate aminotransferase